MTDHFDHFWTRQGLWPVDDNRYTFILRAISNIARAMFGHEWNDADAFAMPLPLLPSDQSAASLDEVRNVARSVGASAAPPQFWPYETDRQSVESADWERARTEREALKTKAERWLELSQSVARELRHGNLRTGLRRLEGGAIEPGLAAEHWNFERYLIRFAKGQIDLGSPLRQELEGTDDIHSDDHRYQDYRWLFVENESLKVMIRKLQGGRNAGGIPKDARQQESECEKWIFEIIERSPTVRTMSRKELRKEAQIRWRGISARAVFRARTAAIVKVEARSASKGLNTSEGNGGEKVSGLCDAWRSGGSP